MDDRMGVCPWGAQVLNHKGYQEEPDFIGKDYMGAQPRSVFYYPASPFVPALDVFFLSVPRRAAPVSADSIPSGAQSADVIAVIRTLNSRHQLAMRASSTDSYRVAMRQRILAGQ